MAPPGARVTGGCRLPEVGAGNQTPGPLQEQYAFLTAEPSLQSCGAYVLLMATMNKNKILVSAGRKIEHR